MIRQIAAVVGAAALAACVSGGAMAQERKLTIVTFGGEPDAAYEKTIYKAFREKTGIRLVVDTWSGKELAMVRAQVEQKNVEWDVLFTDFDRVITGCEQGFLTPIPKDIIGPVDDYFGGSVHECGVPFDVFGSTINYDAGRPPAAWGGKTPTTFLDFWDVQKFPGKRGVRKQIKVTAEQAIMADGVPNDKVYEVMGAPGGIERVLAKLESIRSHLVFWSRNPQAPQMLADGEVVMSTGNSARFLAHNQQGRKFEVIWDRMVWSNNMLVAPKGPRVKDALELIAFMIKPENMAAPTKFLSYGPSRKSAMQFVDPQDREMLTTAPAHLKTALHRNEDFWVEREAEFDKKFAVWLSK